jgi:hypothetical protein
VQSDGERFVDEIGDHVPPTWIVNKPPTPYGEPGRRG